MEKITVITVCLNAEKTIEQTIKSIFDQKMACYEMIFVDGKSQDFTNDIIENYRGIAEGKGIIYRHYSESDDGIYFAMNKGIELAKGDWVIFLNSGDIFADDYVLSDVFSDDISQEIGCIYGDTINRLGGVSFYKESGSIDSLTYRNPYIHQALFVRLSILRDFAFDTSYVYAADFNQSVNMYLSGVKFKKISRCISEYELSGLSQKHTFQTIKEFEVIRKRNRIASQSIAKRFFLYFCVLVIKNNPIFYRLYICMNGLRKNKK